MARSCPPLPSLGHCGCVQTAAIYWRIPADSQVSEMLELSPKRTANPQAPSAVGNQQSRRLLLALMILLAALAVILIEDRQFWFGSEQSTIEADVPEPAAASQTAAKPAVPPAPALAAHATRKQLAAAAPSADSRPSDAPVVSATRTVLPPLDVEVVAGDTHKKLHPGSTSAKLETTSAATQSAPVTPPATSAAQREPIVDAQPTYPLLAQHMNVQGSVILQALIGTDGVVENLRVLSGPAILASAAQQAVREWRFKPILQDGRPVESKATITVNFTIKVADSSAKTTLAESRAAESLIITR